VLLDHTLDNLSNTFSNLKKLMSRETFRFNVFFEVLNLICFFIARVNTSHTKRGGTPVVIQRIRFVLNNIFEIIIYRNRKKGREAGYFWLRFFSNFNF